MAGGVSASGTGAPPQAGVLDGVNPIVYNPANPIILFIVQASGPFLVAHPAMGNSVQVRAPAAVSGRTGICAVVTHLCVFRSATQWGRQPGPSWPGRFPCSGPER
jgi:hypothetical protein